VTTIDIDSITVPKERQRRGVGNCDDLIESIPRLGLIQPIVVTRDLVLVAGGRRLFSMRKLGWAFLTHPDHFLYTEELDELVLREIELEENIKRKNLSWQDEVQAIAQLHELRTQRQENWTQEDTAKAMGLSPSHLSRVLSVTDYAKQDGTVYEAQKLSVAINAVDRAKQRQRQARLQDFDEDAAAEPVEDSDVSFSLDDEEPPKPAPAPKPKKKRETTVKYPLVNADAFEFFADYDGPTFNFLHVDFPYGTNTGSGKTSRMGATNRETYDDDPDLFFKLTEKLLPALPIANDAHMMFWFSPNYYIWTQQKLVELGWKVDPYPLIWHREDGKGIIPDPRRSGRYIYEMCFHCTRGDRKIVRPVKNLVPAPRGETAHPAQKPTAVLEHFFRMFVDASSYVLDPTCGSGTSVRTARDMGAAQVLGVEKSEPFYQTACALWAKRDKEFDL
jgi:ParB/RepB/Spo0J family partition protein